MLQNSKNSLLRVLRVYFYKRCAGGPKSKDFWPTIKPFLSMKSCYLCELFNDHFVNVAKDIGKSSDQYKDDFSDHPSIAKILENTPQCESDQKFTFKPVGEKYVHKIISNFNVKKATGADNISAKTLKSCSSSISSSIANLVNKSFETCKFPNFM